MKKIFKIYPIIFVILIQNLSAQESEEQTKPVELPGVIFFGKEQLKISSSIKQFPNRPSKLSSAELDSLNTLEKQQIFIIPTKPLPTSITKIDFKKNYLDAKFGSFLTPNAEAGFNFDLLNLNFFAKANFELSNGHLDKAGYSKIAFTIANDFIAPEKYWIFGGSRTNSIFSIKNNNYNLYSFPSATNRNLFDLNFNIKSEGNFEGFHFYTGGKAGIMQLSQDIGNAFDNYICGFVKIRNKYDNFYIGGNLSLDLHSIRGDGLSFFELSGNFAYSLFEAKLGIQLGSTSNSETKANILIEGKFNYYFNEDFSFKASISQELINNSFSDMMILNPYLSDSAKINFETSRTLKAYMFYKPNTKFLLSAGIFLGFNENTPYFISDSSGAFILNYGSTNCFGVNTEGSWQISQEDNLNYNLELNFKTLKDNSNIVPHHIPFKFAITYRRQWTNELSSNISITYVSQRYADLQNIKILDAYLNVNLFVNYKISNTFSIFAKFENLLNSDMRIWEGYKERGIFVSGGLLWEF